MTKIAIVNDKDEIVGSAEKGEARKQGLIHRITRIFVHDGNGKVLLQKRHPKAHDSPNKWDFSAAGHVDEGENYEQAAKRELEEELGLEDVPLTILFSFYTEKTADVERIRRFNTVFLAKVNDHTIVRPNLAELGGVEWFTKTQVTDMIRNNPDDFSSSIKEKYPQILKHLD